MQRVITNLYIISITYSYDKFNWRLVEMKVKTKQSAISLDEVGTLERGDGEEGKPKWAPWSV